LTVAVEDGRRESDAEDEDEDATLSTHVSAAAVPTAAARAPAFDDNDTSSEVRAQHLLTRCFAGFCRTVICVI